MGVRRRWEGYSRRRGIRRCWEGYSEVLGGVFKGISASKWGIRDFLDFNSNGFSHTGMSNNPDQVDLLAGRPAARRGIRRCCEGYPAGR